MCMVPCNGRCWAISHCRASALWVVETFNSEKVAKEVIVKLVEEEFDLRPKSIIEMLDLKRPIYQQTAAYGHFGRIDIELSWEKTDRAEKLKK